MATYTATVKGTQKLYGFYGNGNGATYTITATNGTGVMRKFDVVRRPIRGGAGSVVGTSGSGVAVSYTENARFDFELEVWADVSTVGTFTVAVTSSGGGDTINMSPYLLDSSANAVAFVGPDGLITPMSDGALAMRKLRRATIAAAKQRAGVSNMKVLCVGDSTTAGLPGDGTYTGRTTSYPSILAANLVAKGATAKLNSWFSEPTNTFNTTNFGTYDSRWTIGANWTLTSLGTNYVRQFTFNNATPANLTFTPAQSCDTYEVYYVSNPAYGTVTIASTGASPSTINMAAAVAIRKATITVTAGQPLIITPPISTAVNVLGIIGYTAATKEVSVLNFGLGGARSAALSDRTQVYSNSYLMDTIAPDLAIVMLGINDWLNSVSSSTYSANIQSILTQFAAISCDCVLMTPIPSAISNVALATQQEFRTAVLTLAASNGVPVVDHFGQWLSYETTQPLGYYQASQTVHPSVSGYNVVGIATAGAIAPLFV